jgi:hypothetical protein
VTRAAGEALGVDGLTYSDQKLTLRLTLVKLGTQACAPSLLTALTTIPLTGLAANLSGTENSRPVLAKGTLQLAAVNEAPIWHKVVLSGLVAGVDDETPTVTVAGVVCDKVAVAVPPLKFRTLPPVKPVPLIQPDVGLNLALTGPVTSSEQDGFLQALMVKVSALQVSA